VTTASGLGRLALARGTVDRVTERRTDKEWLDAAWADPRSRVLVVNDGHVLIRLHGGDIQVRDGWSVGGQARDGQVRDGQGSAELVFAQPADAPESGRYLLGQDADGAVYFGIHGELPDRGAEPEGTRVLSLRSVGALLSDRDAGLMTHAVALDNWHTTHTHCPRCGTPTIVDAGGHSARCPADGTEHFPRTDPAVIMLVTDPDDRCLLARNAAWPQRRFSILAGFVDPGESAEQAVVREVHEETAIKVENVAYLGSQPWPMPRSLMLGFRADAPAGQQIRVDNEELTEAIWFTRPQLLASLQAGELAIAPSVSIARRIIEYWYGAELPG
jgi:NAD+ diphosphatase